MKELNFAAESMPRSGIRVLLDEADKIGDVLHLEIGQPDFPTPAHIIEAATQAAYEGYTGYTPNAGYMSLREAFAARLKNDHGLDIPAERVVVSVGAMGALFNAFCVTVAPGDEVLIPDPGYPNYYMPVQLLGARAVPYPLEAAPSGFSINPEVLRSLITERTKVIIVNSPSNPTGLVECGETLQKIVELAQEHGLYIISDEAYDHIIFDGTHLSPLLYDDNGCVIATYSCSKTYSMTGWRVGFVVSPPAITPVITKLQEAYISCAPSVSQKAAEAALNGPQDCVKEMVEVYCRRRQTAMDLCDELGIDYIRPKGAFYLMVALPEAARHDSMGFALRLVKEARVAVAPGVTFGLKGEGYVRLSLCSSEETIREGLMRLAAVYQKL